MVEKLKRKNKPKTPRNKEKYAALNVRRQVPNRRDLLDMDYLDKLSPSEKDWLNRALEETVISNFNHHGKIIDGSPEAKKRAYDANNARNRCEYTRAKHRGLVDNMPTQSHFNALLDKNAQTAYAAIEDSIIRAIDFENKKKSKSKKRG